MQKGARLRREFEELLHSNHLGTCPVIELIDGQIRYWRVVITGPEGSPYEDGKFELQLKFPDDHPLSPPKIKFITKIFHPNIAGDGRICLNELRPEYWTVSYNVESLIIAIRSLMWDPNPVSPVNNEAADLYCGNGLAFNQRARQMTEKYASSVTRTAPKVRKRRSKVVPAEQNSSSRNKRVARRPERQRNTVESDGIPYQTTNLNIRIGNFGDFIDRRNH